jgi:hypothetical protein
MVAVESSGLLLYSAVSLPSVPLCQLAPNLPPAYLVVGFVSMIWSLLLPLD